MKLNSTFILDDDTETEIDNQIRNFVTNYERVRKHTAKDSDKDMIYAILLMLAVTANSPSLREYAFREVAWLEADIPKIKGGFTSIVTRFIRGKDKMKQLRNSELIANNCVMEAIAAKRMYLAHNKNDSWTNKLSILWLWVTIMYLRNQANQLLADRGPAYRDVLQWTCKLVDSLVYFDVERLNNRIKVESAIQQIKRHG